MDLSILVGDTVLYIRVVGLVETPSGFLFEKKNDREYIFPLGGKIMINETSKEAIKREILEEIGMEVKDLTLCSIIENLYSTPKEKVHEVCFVYKIDDIFTDKLPNGFVEVSKEDFNKYDIRPSPIVSLINESSEFKHVLIK